MSVRVAATTIKWKPPKLKTNDLIRSKERARAGYNIINEVKYTGIVFPTSRMLALSIEFSQPIKCMDSLLLLWEIRDEKIDDSWFNNWLTRNIQKHTFISFISKTIKTVMQIIIILKYVTLDNIHYIICMDSFWKKMLIYIFITKS